jgi:uncharacterized protein YggE
MRSRLARTVAAVALVGAATAAAVVALGGEAGATLAPGQRAITVTGSGTARVPIDTAQWSFGVQTTAATADVALNRTSRTIAKVIAALKAAGVAAGDLRTESVSLYPITGPRGTVTGFSAGNQVTVTVRDIRKAAKLVSVAAKAGANNVYGPTFTTANTDAAYKTALEAALAQARDKAAFLAAKSGVTVGLILELTEGSAANVLGAPTYAGGEGGAAPPVLPGQQDVQAFVTVTFGVA